MMLPSFRGRTTYGSSPKAFGIIPRLKQVQIGYPLEKIWFPNRSLFRSRRMLRRPLRVQIPPSSPIGPSAGPPEGDVSSVAEHRAVNADASVRFRYVTPPRAGS